MSCKACDVQYEFRKKFNRVNSDFNQHITVPEIDYYVNEALQIFFENRSLVAEANSKVRNDLRELECKKIKLECAKTDKTCCVVNYPEDFYKLLRQEANATKDSCTRDLIIHITQSDDLSESLKDPFHKPSFEWEETLADEGKQGLYVYHNGDFKINHITIDYYRKPKRFQTPSLTPDKFYIDSCGEKIEDDVDLELCSTYQARKITDLAVLLAFRDTMSTDEFTSQQQKIMAVENIYIT